MISISVINLSTVVSDRDAEHAVIGLQTQVSRDFAPHWGVDANLTFTSKSGSAPAPESWWLVILDDADAADALGYHDLTSTGKPLGKVFAKADLESGANWTGTASHELLEMLGDPWANRLAPSQLDPKGAVFYTYEVCDACEDDAYGYKIGDVQVSDFVLPAWFEATPPSGPTKYDYQGLISAPFGLLPGGYIGVLDPRLGWTQINQPHVASKSFAERRASHQVRLAVGSRRDKRIRKAIGSPMIRSTPGAGPGRRPGAAAAAIVDLCMAMVGA